MGAVYGVYTGHEKHKYIDWLVFTVIMGAIPLIIRFIIFSFFFFGQPFVFSDYRADFFFLSIVLVVDSLRNYGVKSIGGVVSILILITCITAYSIAFFETSQLLNSAPSGELMQRVAIITLALGFIVDLFSLSKK